MLSLLTERVVLGSSLGDRTGLTRVVSVGAVELAEGLESDGDVRGRRDGEAAPIKSSEM